MKPLTVNVLILIILVLIVEIFIHLFKNVGLIFIKINDSYFFEDMTLVKSVMDLWSNPPVCFMYAEK